MQKLQDQSYLNREAETLCLSFLGMATSYNVLQSLVHYHKHIHPKNPTTQLLGVKSSFCWRYKHLVELEFCSETLILFKINVKMHLSHLLKYPRIHNQHFTWPKSPFPVLIDNPEGWKTSPEIWCLAHSDVVQILSSPKLELSSNNHKYHHVRNWSLIALSGSSFTEVNTKAVWLGFHNQTLSHCYWTAVKLFIQN